MKTAKRLLCLALALMMLLCMTACAKDPVTTTTDPEKPTGDSASGKYDFGGKKIKIAIWYEPKIPTLGNSDAEDAWYYSLMNAAEEFNCEVEWIVDTQEAHFNTGSSLDAVMNSAASSGILESLNLSKYLTGLGLSDKLVGILTAPVDKVYEIVTCSGIQIFIFLAALYSVPPDLYAAARVEGANGWEQFWIITFPMVMPMILVNVVYSIVDTFVSESNLVMEYVYQLSFKNFNFGLSSAITWIYFAAIAAILAIVYAVISRKTFYYT